jgi:hypothetical protein
MERCNLLDHEYDGGGSNHHIMTVVTEHCREVIIEISAELLKIQT